MNEQLSFDLKKFLAQLTSEPGVYRMLAANGDVLYIGKAANLKKRVKSYFNKLNTSAKTQALVNQIARIEVQITRTETEALLLESSLIKSLTPKYNVLMRDDKSYPYLTLTSHHKFPRLSIIRVKKKPEKGIFFGPYPSVAAVRETLSIIQKVFKIRNCTESYFNARLRPCLQFQIQRCSAPCTLLINEEAYKQAVANAVAFLQGKSNHILQELESKMEEAVVNHAFEEAAIYRDQIKSLRLVQEQQGIVRIKGDADVIVLDTQPGFACILCVHIRNGHVQGSKTFFPSMPKIDVDLESSLDQQVFTTFIAYYYFDNPERIPELIVTNTTLGDREVLESSLTEKRGKFCQIMTKPRGVKARWLEFALSNLQLVVSERQTSAETLKMRFLALQEFLGLSKPINNMICFDISHTQGNSTVASCVAFNQSGPNKKHYRRYNIMGLTPGDDYAAMEQALIRHFKRLTPEEIPEVVIIDGGKGQVGIAKKVLDSLNLDTAALLGIAKGPDRKAGLEKLVFADGVVTSIPSNSPALHLLQHIRDESHRFAITLHRKQRQRSSMRSTLEAIEGIGVKRRQALLRRFGGLQELAKASIEELCKVEGINYELALRIYQHFRN